MARYIDIEKLKPLLDGAFAEGKEAEILEGIMSGSEDYDEKAIDTRIENAVAAARAEESAAYAQKLHNMFFNNAKPESDEVTFNVQDDRNVNPEIARGTADIPEDDIWETVN